MKPQFVIGIKNEIFQNIGLKNGLNPITVEQLLEQLQPGIVIGQREVLENDETVRQVLPYAIFSQFDESAGCMKYIVYRRTKLVGESRLAGNVSVGFGGHIDLEDVAHKDSIIDLVGTIGQAIGREIHEELVFTGLEGHELSMFSVGILLDESDAVGRVHMGVIFNIQLPPGATAVCAEEELESMLPMTASELLNSGLPLENWTRISLEFLEQVEAM
jgi:predicted NUDIX family phosphoesterase